MITPLLKKHLGVLYLLKGMLSAEASETNGAIMKKYRQLNDILKQKKMIGCLIAQYAGFCPMNRKYGYSNLFVGQISNGP